MNRIQFGRVRSTCSNFIRGPKTEPCVSAALAVAGVSVVVCLTLRKRGLMPKRMTRERGVGWGGRQERYGKKEFAALPVRLWHCSVDKPMSKRNHCFK